MKTDYDGDEVLMHQWEKCNFLVMSWILGSLTGEVYNGQIFSKNASRVWQELKEIYKKKSKVVW